MYIVTVMLNNFPKHNQPLNINCYDGNSVFSHFEITQLNKEQAVTATAYVCLLENDSLCVILDERGSRSFSGPGVPMVCENVG